jgi:hypothetical protein
MNAMPSSKKRKPALHLDPESLSAASNPLSHLNATRGSTNEMDTTLMNEQSIEQSTASTTTPSPSALSFFDNFIRDPITNTLVALEESQPKNVFAVKVCEQLHYIFYLLTLSNRIQISSFLASDVRVMLPQKARKIKRL